MGDFEHWTERPQPNLRPVDGRYVRVEPLRLPDDADALFMALGGSENDALWRFIPFGPFENANLMDETLSARITKDAWHACIVRSREKPEALGTASFMRIRPDAGSAEVGCIILSKALQRTRAATEAMYLMARHLFDDLGYRRYEWKCNNENDASKRAAIRLGFTFEGVFRQDSIVKGMSRDTAWFSMLDSEWPQAKSAFEAWLAPENFDSDDRQKRKLEELRQGQ